MPGASFEAEIARATRIDQVWQALVDFARARRVERIAYHHLPPAAAPDAAQLRIENAGFGDLLLKLYLQARSSGVAALAAALQNSAQPIYLDEFAASPDLTPAERAQIDLYREAGVGAVVALQAFGPHGRNGIFALELEEGLVRLPPNVLSEMRWACQAMHLRYCEVLMPMLGRKPELSAREAEVLAWAARGKTNAAIAEILGISAHTVDAHMRRVYLKLGVFDRVSAALRGLGLGLISLDG